jgi:hypothetical protein
VAAGAEKDARAPDAKVGDAAEEDMADAVADAMEDAAEVAAVAHETPAQQLPAVKPRKDRHPRATSATRFSTPP